MQANARRSLEALEAWESREQKAEVGDEYRHAKLPDRDVVYGQAIASIHRLHSGARPAERCVKIP